MLGTYFNTAAIILGGFLGYLLIRPLNANQQNFLKTGLAVFTIFFGLRLVWESVNGTFFQILGQLGIVIISLMAGSIVGRLFRLQHTSNRLGQYARERMIAARPDSPNRFNDGFNVCSLLFCFAPLAWLGAVTEGLTGKDGSSPYFYPLVVKAVMDGLATMSFVKMFGAGAILSALPVFALQGCITVACATYALPFLEKHHTLVEHNLANSVNATSGILIVCVGFLIMEIKKVPVTDYLPSLLFAPLFTWLLVR